MGLAWFKVHREKLKFPFNEIAHVQTFALNLSSLNSRSACFATAVVLINYANKGVQALTTKTFKSRGKVAGNIVFYLSFCFVFRVSAAVVLPLCIFLT